MSNLREFSLCGSSVSSMGQIEDLQYDEEKETIVSIKILHSANLKSMQGLQPFTKLIELTLSDNAIEKIEALQSCVCLKSLNLSCNRIRKIEGLAALNKLEKLILSSNRIASLHPLSQIGGEDYSLTYFDIKDNKLRDLSELQHLNCLVKLKELHLTLEEESNPIFQDKARYIRMLSMQPIVAQLQKIDGKTAKVFFGTGSSARKTPLITIEDKPDDSFTENIETINRQHWSPDFAASPPKQKQGENRAPGSSNKPKPRVSVDRVLKPSSRENVDDNEVRNYPSTERYNKHKGPEEGGNLSSRVTKLEREIRTLSKENKEYHDMNAELIHDINSKNRDLADLTSTISVIMNKKGKKAQPEEKYEDDLDEQEPKERPKTSREGRMKNLELTRNSENMSPLVSDRKSFRYHQESHLSRGDLENDNNGTHHDKILWCKYEELERAYRECCRELVELETRNKELLIMVKDWETRFKLRAEQEEPYGAQRLIEKEKEFHKKTVEMREKCHQDLRVQEEKFKETMDTLEAEFKKILIENRDKISELKGQLQEKCEIEAHLEKIAQRQANEAEELQRKQREKDSQIRTLQLLTEKLEKEKTKLANELTEYRAVKTHRSQDRATSATRSSKADSQGRGKQVDSEHFGNLIEGKILTLNDERFYLESAPTERGMNSLHRSQKIYDTKGDNPDSYKSFNDRERVIQNLQKELQSRDQELVRSRERLAESRNAFTEEIEDQKKVNQHLQEEIDGLKEQFRQRERSLTPNRSDKGSKKPVSENGILQKQLLELERENQELNEELESAQQVLREKVIQITELEEVLGETRALAIRHQNRAQTLEEELRARDSEIEKSMKVKEKEIESLRKKLILNQEEMKKLVQEIEKQKLIAQENMEKINMIFK